MTEREPDYADQTATSAMSEAMEDLTGTLAALEAAVDALNFGPIPELWELDTWRQMLASAGRLLGHHAAFCDQIVDARVLL